eukprot:5622711-Pyramimonas_sp.AAC.1
MPCIRTGALASAPAAFPLKVMVTLRRFGVVPKPAPEQPQRSPSIFPFVIRDLGSRRLMDLLP